MEEEFDKPGVEEIQKVLIDAHELIGSNQIDELDRRLGELVKTIQSLHPQLINANLRATFIWRDGLPNWFRLRDAAIQEYTRRELDVQTWLVGLINQKRPERLLTKENYEETRLFHLGWLWIYRNADGIVKPVIGYSEVSYQQAIKYNQMALASLRKAYYHDRMWSFTLKQVMDKYPT